MPAVSTAKSPDFTGLGSERGPGELFGGVGTNSPRRAHQGLRSLAPVSEKGGVSRTKDGDSRVGVTGTLTGLDTETLPPVTRAGQGEEPVVVGVTLLCHPDLSRVGEQAHLQPLAHLQPAELSRTSPELRQPGASRSRPLADPYLSRRPMVLRWQGDRLELTGALVRHALVVDGEPVRGERLEIEVERLERGVVLELGGRVALLAHFLGMPRSQGDDLGLVGASEAMARVRAEALRVAHTAVPVLLRGASGTGKELVAQAIHDHSGRGDGPFVSVNMAAIPATTAASGLFGHVKGAFTGATAPSVGYFGQAAGGTLFLDEIGDTPLEVQVLLLRALESGEVQPVGASSVRSVDVRLITATESDLEAAAAAGRMRSAFLHRLAGYEIRLPTLRQRPDDVARLLVHFLHEELAALGQQHKLDPPADRRAPAVLDPTLVSRLVRHRWPGNVRQLRNVARHLSIGSQESSTIASNEAVERLLGEAALSVPPAHPPVGSPPRPTSTRTAAEITDQELVEALRAVQFRPGAAAGRLGIGRTTMYKLIDECPAIRKATDLSDGELRQSWLDCAGDVVEMARRLEVSERALKLRLRRFDPPDER